MLSTKDIGAVENFDNFLRDDIDKELLRFTTAGSVDDGKSTLIGRLLHDSKSVYEDQLASVKKSRINRSGGEIDFSLLTDGLRAEREQGITIDVAYRYFSTARRKFIIADTPGHEEYTRNMATGASTADLAIILVDATKGLLSQTRRHTHIASLLGIPSLLVAINKLDLLDFREDAFVRLEKDFLALAGQLGIHSIQCVPISALAGDNVAMRSKNTPWYSGPTLLEHLETVEIHPLAAVEDFRFPVQYVVRPDANFRGFAGRVAGGTVRPGDALLALPSGRQTRLQSIVTFDGDLPEASPGMSVTLKLEDEIDLSRGGMLVSPEAIPQSSLRFDAMTVWLHSRPLELNHVYLVKHTGRHVKAKATQIRYRVDVNTFAHAPAQQLEMNGIACVEFETTESLFFDTYQRNRTTGSFIVIDALTNATVGAGMIQGSSSSEVKATQTPGALFPVTSQERSLRHGHRPGVIFARDTGQANRLERELFKNHFAVVALADGELSQQTRLATARALLQAGLIVIVVSDGFEKAVSSVLNNLASDPLLDVSREDDSLSNADFLQRVLRFANELRAPAAAKNSEEVY